MKLCTSFFCALFCGAILSGQSAPEIPRLQKQGTATQLIVDGKPFLALAGELHNSSSSSLDYMRPIWGKLAQANLNTVLAVVSWDLIEPEEGKFDFTLVDGLLEQARSNNLRVMLLWFGSWKNGMSHYVPDWVKSDFERFPRVRLRTGAVEVLSTLSEENLKCDARAFAALMHHVREVDSQDRTVIMVQVQNEVGVLGDSRDRGELANQAFAKPVPSELMDYLRRHKDDLLPELRDVWARTGFRASGTWGEVFGSGSATDEIFMAWNYARHTNRVTEAGKAEYPLPMFVNAWIVQPEDELPGDYPSGGPQAHMHDVWRAGAPEIDILAPDIYLPDFTSICELYSRSGNPLFVPESRADVQGAANVFAAVGQFNAIGYSPFGIDSRLRDPQGGPIAKAYKTLSQLAPLILQHQGTGTIAGISLDRRNRTAKFRVGDYTLNAGLRTNRRSSELPELGYGIFIAVGPDEYYVAGSNLQLTFSANNPGPPTVGLATLEEGVFVDGRWTPGRTLNGDAIMIDYDMASMAATHQTGTGVRFRGDDPEIMRVKLYRFE